MPVYEGVDFVDEPVLLYPTLADLLERVIWRYESGIYSVGSDRRLMGITIVAASSMALRPT